MPYQNIYLLDRASFLLDAQLLSSLTSGTFTGSSSSVLGTQSWNMPAGYNAIITIEQEQILLSAMSITGGTITCTIATRGYDGTIAATHAAGTVAELHLTKGHIDGMQNELGPVTQGFILQSSVTTIVAANQHTVSGDQTSVFTVGRVYLFKIGSTWYRAIVRSSSYGGGTTTINLTGDGLPASGTIVSAGFEFIGSLNKPVDYLLVKEATNIPADAPPSGYCWLFAKGKAWYLKDSSGVSRRLSIVQATSSSSSGVLTLDWSLADVYDCTLTENITGVTHQNGADGEEYVLRIKQHASAAKTVALGTSGGTRFSDSVASYTATTVLSAYDILRFRFNGTDAKYDITDVKNGYASSPSGNATPATKDDVRKNVAIMTAGENINAGEPVYIPQASSTTLATTNGTDDATVGNSAWTTPTYIYADDANYAYIAGGQYANVDSHYLKALGFGFSIPAGASIQGIKVNFKRVFVSGGASSTVYDTAIKLVKAGTIGSTNRSTGQGWNGTEQTDSFGSITDLWGDTWTPSDINNANFGVVLAAHLNGTTGSPATAYGKVNYVTITVYYYYNGQVFRANASTVAVKGYCGIAVEAKTTGNSIRIAKPGGISDAQSGLETGKWYYIGNSAGLLQQTAGTVSARVGLAISPTELLVMHDVTA